jgi:hypothetical protein
MPLFNDTDLHFGSADNATIQQLQTTLATLGFALVNGDAPGNFGLATYWAVREFQSYASMDTVAVEAHPSAAVYADRLDPAPTGPAKYQGRVSGVVDAATRVTLQAWLDSKFRCPVVIEAWRMTGGQRSSIVASNLWLFDSLKDTGPRVFAVDLSGYFQPMPADRRVVIGDAVFDPAKAFLGPHSAPPNHTIPEGEVLPEALVGKPLAPPLTAERSTFKVVRSTAEVECIGFFDAINAYDNALISTGPCQWTLGIMSGNNVSRGELCGYLAFLKQFGRAGYDKLLGHFGVDVDRDWVDAAGQPTGKALFESGQRKYVAWLRLSDEQGQMQGLKAQKTDANFMRSWHWFYRFAMAGRTIEPYRLAMWPMARIRVRDILSASLEGSVQIGQAFTSELAVAVLVRWHIRFPDNMIRNGRAAPTLVGILNRARQSGGSWPPNPANWTQDNEDRLVAALRDASQTAGGGLQDSIPAVMNWPDWTTGNNPRKYKLDKTIGRLNPARGSFLFDSSNLPPPPF